MKQIKVQINHKGKQKSRNNESEKPSSNSEVSLQVDLKSMCLKRAIIIVNGNTS